MTGRRRAGFLALSGALGTMTLALGACTTASLEDAFPQASASQPTQTAQEPVFSRPGDYPNLNVQPQPAAAQLTEDERRAMTDELRARRDALTARSPGSGQRTNAAALRRLADTHAADTLRAIEGN